MTKLTWDESGEKIFETGLDRGVLYLNDGSGVAWNGLTSFDENDVNGVEEYIFDGHKIGNFPFSGDFTGKLKAFTYPDEFLSYTGVETNNDISGLQIPYQAGRLSFGLSYRTLVGDDVDGIDFGYKIHILYNLIAIQDEIEYKSLGDDLDPYEFGWEVFSTPEFVDGFHPTAHVVVDTRYLSETRLSHLEDILYGTETSQPRLPGLSDLIESVTNSFLVTITDNGDGSWTAEGPDDLVFMTDETTFSIISDGVTVIDPDTYDITSA